MKLPQIHLPSFITGYLPPALRMPRFMAWLRVFMAPLQRRMAEIYAFATEMEIQVRLSSQVVVLESRLNDLFDSTARTIWIEEVDDDVYLPFTYWVAEAQPPIFVSFVVDLPVILPRVSNMEEVEAANKFIVHAESSAADPTAIRSFLNQHKAAGTSYILLT